MAHAKLNWLMTLQAHHLFGEEDVIVFHLFGSGVAVGREHVAAFGRGFKRGGAEAAEDMSAQNLCVLSVSAFLCLNTLSIAPLFVIKWIQFTNIVNEFVEVTCGLGCFNSALF